MKKKLKNLKEYNEQAINNSQMINDNTPILNGIACPKCGEELYDSDPLVTLMTYPSQKNVCCSKCDFIGYRIA